ncbi:MAG: DUF1957 domain-containing protein [Capsulimonadaceae bacterium]|nr:DUF1957 domain-containing protein [Capsulimonadaceae bacterium]
MPTVNGLQMTTGSFTFALHSHMPYVLSHGRSPHGSDWLCEAAAESYLPLLNVCHRLVADGISPCITLGLTPVLMEQLADPRFQIAFAAFIDERASMASRDSAEFDAAGNTRMAELARWWRDWHLEKLREFTMRWNCDIVAAFGALQEQGRLEIIGGSATHGYSPLFAEDATIAMQVNAGVSAYRRRFGRSPRGYWLPECGYRPRGENSAPGSNGAVRRGIEEFLAARGVEYFFAESGARQGDSASSANLVSSAGALNVPLPARDSGLAPLSPYRAHLVNSAGAPLPSVRAFSRDPATGVQVWSGEVGYPADPWYLDFHRRNSDKGVVPMGLRYWRVSEGDDKQLYEPDRANSRVIAHAQHFASVVASTLAREAPEGDGIVCATYDTELFGHWWFEGAEFLYEAIKAIAALPEIARVTCGEYLDAHPNPGRAVPLPEGSWGAGGGHGVWLNPGTDAIWTRVHAAEATMARLVREYGGAKRTERVLQQAARELLLLTSSDWPFLVTTGGAVDYAWARFNDHCVHFEVLSMLVEQLGSGRELTVSQWKALANCEQRDRIYPWLDLAAYQGG